MSEITIDPKVLREAQLVMLRILKQVDRVCREHGIPYWMDSGTLLGAVRHQGFIPWDDDLDICMMREDYERFLKIAPDVLPPELFLQNFHTDPYFLCNFSKIRDKNSQFISNDEKDQPIRYHQGIFIDIFPMDKLSKRKWIRYFWRSMVFKRLYNTFSIPAKYCQRNLRQPFYRNLIKNVNIILATQVFGKLNFPNKRMAAAIEKLLRGVATVGSNNEERYVVGHGLGISFKETYSHHTVFPLKELQFEDAVFLAPQDHDHYLRVLYGDTYMQFPKEEDRRPLHAAQIIPELKKASSDQPIAG